MKPKTRIAKKEVAARPVTPATASEGTPAAPGPSLGGESRFPPAAPGPSLPRRPINASKPMGDRVFKWLTGGFAGLIVLLVLAMTAALCSASSDAWKAAGWRFFVSQNWDPVQESFGGLAFAYGTLVSSFIAFLLAAPFGIGIALYLTEMSPRFLREPLAFVIEILSAIPSVVYGLWGIFVLAPLLRTYVGPVLIRWIGKPFFTLPSTGLSMLGAGVLLAIMIVPTIMSISREVFLTIPRSAREAALALGTTRWESTMVAVLAPSRTGLLGAMMLGLGRALGETMAVTMIIGNRPEISLNLLGPSHSIASVIANEFAEATSDVHLSALAELGLVLMGITLLINMAARLLVWMTSSRLRISGADA